MYAALSKQSINTDSVGKNNNHVDKKYKRASTFQSSHASKLVSAQCDAIIGLDSTNIDTDDENRFLGSKVRHDAITTRRCRSKSVSITNVGGHDANDDRSTRRCCL